MNDGLSVVIPTRGESFLKETITKLNSSKQKPDEVIIVINKQDLFKVENLKFNNLKIISSNFNDQVNKRIDGFKSCNYNYVMQLDSDIIIGKNVISGLLEKIKKYPYPVSISPKIMINYNLKKNRFISKFEYFLSRVFNEKNKNDSSENLNDLSTWFANPKEIKKTMEINYHHGSIVLFHNNDLITKNYYPYNYEKSYDEDILQSIILRNNGCKIIYCPEIKVESLTVNTYFDNFKSLIIYLYQLFKIKKYIMQTTNGKMYKLLIWFLYYSIKCFVKLFYIFLKKFIFFKK